MTDSKSITGHNIILKYFPEISEDQKNKFAQLQQLYVDWNAKINVISRKDVDLLYEHHVLHSLAIAKFISFKPQTQVLDIGTGGGFPGIPLAILFPEVRFHLVDSIGKKIKVVSEIASSLNLKNVQAEHARAEQLKGRYHFVVSRAVAELSVIYGWAREKIAREGFNDLHNGMLFLKGGDLSDEVNPFKKMANVVELSNYFEEEFFQTKKLVYLPV